jgi:hypothetical protein
MSQCHIFHLKVKHERKESIKVDEKEKKRLPSFIKYFIISFFIYTTPKNLQKGIFRTNL